MSSIMDNDDDDDSFWYSTDDDYMSDHSIVKQRPVLKTAKSCESSTATILEDSTTFMMDDNNNNDNDKIDSSNSSISSKALPTATATPTPTTTTTLVTKRKMMNKKRHGQNTNTNTDINTTNISTKQNNNKMKMKMSSTQQRIQKEMKRKKNASIISKAEKRTFPLPKNETDPLIKSSFQIADNMNSRIRNMKSKLGPHDTYIAPKYSIDYWKIWRSRNQTAVAKEDKDKNDKQEPQLSPEMIKKLKFAKAKKLDRARRKNPKLWDTGAPSLRYSSRHKGCGANVVKFAATSFGEMDELISKYEMHREEPPFRSDWGFDSEFLKELGKQKYDEVPQGIIIPRNPGRSFGTSTRNDWAKMNPLSAWSRNKNVGVNGPYTLEKETLDHVFKKTTGVVFGKTIPPNDDNKVPGPGHYSIEVNKYDKGVGFGKDSTELKHTSESPGPGCNTLPDLQSQVPTSRFSGTVEFFGSKEEDKPDLTLLRPMVGFGKGCNFKEHSLYGSCIDRKCSQRSKWEETNNILVKSNKDIDLQEEFDDVKERLREDITPLQYGCIYNELETVHKLCVGGVNVDEQDRNGQTALHIACREGHFQIVERIVNNVKYPFITEKGYIRKRKPPNLNIQDKNGQTCGHIASLKGNRILAEYLFASGIDPSITDNEGHMSTDIAEDHQIYSTLNYQMDLHKRRVWLADITKQVDAKKKAFDLIEDVAQIRMIRPDLTAKLNKIKEKLAAKKVDLDYIASTRKTLQRLSGLNLTVGNYKEKLLVAREQAMSFRASTRGSLSDSLRGSRSESLMSSRTSIDDHKVQSRMTPRQMALEQKKKKEKEGKKKSVKNDSLDQTIDLLKFNEIEEENSDSKDFIFFDDGVEDDIISIDTLKSKIYKDSVGSYASSGEIEDDSLHSIVSNNTLDSFEKMFQESDEGSSVVEFKFDYDNSDGEYDD